MRAGSILLAWISIGSLACGTAHTLPVEPDASMRTDAVVRDPPDASPDVPPDAPWDAPSDAPPDPCEMVACASLTPLCRAGVCVECNDSTACGGGTPICDVGRGRCAPRAPTFCGPCSAGSDCLAPDGTSFGECVPRGGADEPNEVVCLPTCTESSMCPRGYRCDGTHCIPGGGGSCTQQRAALTRQACSTDGDCAPVGATWATGLIRGSCVTMLCRTPCGFSLDCSEELSTCDTEFFCAP